MKTEISTLVGMYETGRISRRELIGQLTAASMALGAFGPRAQAQASGSVFEAVSLNHIALRVTDVPRSRDFYQKMLGLKTDRDSEESSFLSFDRGFLALFKGDTPRLDHYCYSIKNYNVDQAAEKLRAEGIEPRLPEGTGRIYFPDPDGHEVQLAAEEHRA